MTTLTQNHSLPEFAELQEHFRQCISARGRLHWWHCAVESMDAFLAPRFITALVVVVSLAMIGLSLPLQS